MNDKMNRIKPPMPGMNAIRSNHGENPPSRKRRHHIARHGIKIANPKIAINAPNITAKAVIPLVMPTNNRIHKIK